MTFVAAGMACSRERVSLARDPRTSGLHSVKNSLIRTNCQIVVGRASVLARPRDGTARMLQLQCSSTGNSILASLSPRDFGSLAPHLDPVAFKVRHVFFRPHEPIETVVFPESGFASVVATTASGRSLEVGTIGREGVIGAPVIFGQTLTPYNSYAQVAGAGFEIRADILWDAMKQSWPLADSY